MSRDGIIIRSPQGLGSFVRGEPSSGYYNDLRGKATAFGDAPAALAALGEMLANRDRLVPVDVAQLGLGAWQCGEGWQEVAVRAADGLAAAMSDDGRLWHRFPLRHTYRLRVPWSSAMAQGEAASLFIRVGLDADREDLVRAAAAAVRPLVEREPDIVHVSTAGPVLQEYPTVPSSHVLNGWIFGLWGLYDLASIGDPRAAAEFDAGVAALAELVPRYDVVGGWSRYDLYPHPLKHVASPFYHRLHVAQLEAMDILVEGRPFAGWVERWTASAMWSPRVGAAVARKVAFRVVRPRRGRASR